MSTSQQQVERLPASQGPEAGAMPAERILARTQESRPVVQDYVFLAQSLEWQLGQAYLREHGSASFTADSFPVPWVVNNDGGLSRRAAELFYEGVGNREQETGDREQGAEPIYVLELGVGVGLFARFFLDHFRELCRRNQKDYYDRLCYILADKSPRMLYDVSRHGILAGHAGRYRLRVVDALKVDERLPFDVCFERREGKRRFSVVILNYLLDCLPAAVLDVSDEAAVKLLHVRTCLARNVNLADHTDMRIEQLRERAAAVAGGEDSVASERARRELLEVYGLFASEYAYLPLKQPVLSNQQPASDTAAAEAPPVPYLDFALSFARKHSKRALHSYGAIQCLEKLLGLVEDDGFILINDYGQAEIKADDDYEHQRFSQATFIGVNFPLLEEYFGDQLSAVRSQQAGSGDDEGGDPGSQTPFGNPLSGNSVSRADTRNGVSGETRSQTEFGNEAESMAPGHVATEENVGRVVYPSFDCDAETGRIDNPSYGDASAGPRMYQPFGGDSGGIHSRLLSRGASRETVLRFQTLFGKAEYERVHEPVNKAREAVKVGRFEAAAALYRDGLRRQPNNWVLLGEVANFLTHSLRDPKAGADTAKLALRLNPACSSDLWCTLGDALFEWGRTAEAKSAYQKALSISPNDVRARFNLAFVHTRAKNYRAALAAIADALALDHTGQYRERLLQKQAEVLQLVAVKHQQEYLRMLNLISRPEGKFETRTPKCETNTDPDIRNA